MVALALVSCGSSPDATTGATVGGSTSTTDPYAVPATIDIPYLNRVFLALEKINGDATRLIVANRRITPEAAALLHAILTDDEFKIRAEGWNDDLDEGLEGFKASPGDRVTTVRRIIAVRPDCVALEVARDYSAVTVQGKVDATSFVSLAREAPAAPNPTPWVVSAQLLSGSLPCA